MLLSKRTSNKKWATQFGFNESHTLPKISKEVSHNYNNTNIYTFSFLCLTPSFVILRAANPSANLRAGESRHLFLIAANFDFPKFKK